MSSSWAPTDSPRMSATPRSRRRSSPRRRRRRARSCWRWYWRVAERITLLSCWSGSVTGALDGRPTQVSPRRKAEQMGDDDKTRISPSLGHTGVGTQLSGIYELDERIASGGMGEVYRGHNIQTGDHVAIKIVLPEFARDQTILSLFRKEASILNHLSHDAVVRYHVFTIDPGIGRPYLAMEFVDGQSLFDIMRRGPMPTEEVRKLCHRLASGLAAVHQAGAIHRDLSPDNIILPGDRVDRAN